MNIRFLIHNLCLLAYVFCIGTGNGTAENWPQLQHDPEHTGHTPDQPKPPYSVKWTRDLHEPMQTASQPIVADGKVFVGTGHGNLHALNRDTGETVWIYPTEAPIFGPPAYKGGVVYVCSLDHYCHAVSSDNGNRIWAFETGEPIWASPVIADNKVFVAGRDGFVYALDPEQFRNLSVQLIGQLLSHQDWAIMGPSRLRNVTDIHRLRYFNLQGQATYNSWLAGVIGFTRLAGRYVWETEEDVGYYLAGKLAMARIAQARYVAEMHRMGNVRSAEEDDWRTLLHIDTTCAVVGCGPMGSGVHEEQEFPPFIDLVEEVGHLLEDYAQDECSTYLDYLDYAVPYWYLSEGPKQSATEHRTCPLQHLNGNVLAQYWVLGKQGVEFARYLDTTRFKGDLYYIQNLVAAINSFAEKD